MYFTLLAVRAILLGQKPFFPKSALRVEQFYDFFARLEPTFAKEIISFNLRIKSYNHVVQHLKNCKQL